MKQLMALLIGLLLVSVSPAGAQTLKGWEALRSEINAVNPNAISGLNGRQYRVQLENTSANGLKLTPEAAFQVSSPSSGEFIIEIINAEALVRRVGSVVQKLPVSWEATYILSGKDQFPISIEGVDQCVFSLTFRQKGGEILDLSEASKDFAVSWQVTGTGVLATSEISGRSLVLTRQEGNNGDINVVLRLRSNDGTIDVSSQAVAVPKCGRFVSNSPDNEAIVQLRTPGQCVVPTLQKTDSNSSDLSWNFEESYANSCDRAVRCTFIWPLYRYTSFEDGVARRNSILIDENVQRDIVIKPNQTIFLQARVSSKFEDVPYYSWGHTQTPDGAIDGYRNDFVICRWAY